MHKKYLKINNLSFHLRKLEKEEQIKPKTSRRIEIINCLGWKAIKFTIVINKIKNRKTIKKTNKIKNPVLFFKIFIYLLREGKRGRETSIFWLPPMHPLLGTWPATHACTLIENQTGDTLIHRLASIH